MKYFYFLFAVIFIACNEKPREQKTESNVTRERHRPLIHFTPPAHWMNDPNGLVKFNDEYHLFYQHYPDNTVWGPMHWGHATSTDLVHWTHKPIALYPDSLGYIFSGSAVIDTGNTAGFGKNAMIAIFTHHDSAGEKAGRKTFQNQGIAYSTDGGNTWTKYEKNPVLKNPGIRDFRDPKVSWHTPSKKWIMTLATLDRITFYSSTDLKTWTKESEFGKNVGAHGGVWECPDLFPLYYNGTEVWVLIVSINPGGPNGGSGTQYFTGQFDGHEFTSYDTTVKWIDYGPDDYAGVTFFNTGNRKIFLGWMSNWQYANVVPTEKWRSAMTVPRDLALEKVGDKYYVTSAPSKELNNLESLQGTITNNKFKLSGAAALRITADTIESFSIILSNDSAQKVVVGYDKNANQYYIDRTQSGRISFEKGFASRSVAPRLSTAGKMNMALIIDVASVEMFADNGLTVMTGIFFPDKDFTEVTIDTNSKMDITSLNFGNLKPAF
ncbi:MAG: glycoside hydrolase family 32 protein [Chitinophagaceae bacterium]|nr:glycoside hydrolase family 32 protein [Chitinophagaceae bacterium]